MDVQVVGHVCVDLAPEVLALPGMSPGVLEEIGPARVTVGGVVGNVARAVRGLGGKVAVAATVGADDLGQLCRAVLERDLPGAVHLSETTTRGSSYSVVLQPPGADRTIWHHTGANDEFDGRCELVGASYVHFGYPTLTPGMTRDEGRPTVELFERARAAGSATSLDLSYCASNSPLRDYDWWGYFTRVLPVTDVFCPSWDDVTSALGLPAAFDRDRVEEYADAFLGLGAAVVLITAGEHGSYVRAGSVDRLGHLAEAIGDHVAAWAGESSWIAPAPVRRFVNTNGAGDTFKAAFLVASLERGSAIQAARHAADVVARYIDGLPYGDGTAPGY